LTATIDIRGIGKSQNNHWDKHGPSAHRWHLIVRREVNSPATVKYSLSNADDQTSVNKLAQMQAQRFWIERAFQDAKSHVSMASPIVKD
jgi:hypothetical protein